MNATAFRASFEQSEDASGWTVPDMSILTGGRSAPPAIPTEMFGSLWPLISDLAEGAGAPVDYVAVSVLAVSASLIGAKRRARPYPTSDWSEPCILWVAPVGDPSSNKSPAIDAATGLLRGLEAEYAEGHKQTLNRYEAKAERAKAERGMWQEAVKAATKDNLATPPMPEAAEMPDEPARRRLLVQDATPEAVGEILSGNPNGTLHLRDELAGWLMSFERYSPGGREFWLEAYGGRPHVIDRKSLKKPLTIPFNGVTVLGGIQPEKLSECLLNVADDGLVARFLWAWPDPIRYKRPRQLADIGRLESLYRRLDGLQSVTDAEGREKPIILMLTDGAAEIFEAWAAENGEAVREAASLYKGFCGKLRGTVLRLALACELMGWADAEGPEPDSIGIDAITAAITFIEDYAKPSALRVFGDAALPEADRNAAQLGRHILKRNLPRINARDVRREYGIATLKTSEKVDEAIESLTDAGWLRAAPGRAGASAGRQSKDFIVNPQVHEAAHG